MSIENIKMSKSEQTKLMNMLLKKSQESFLLAIELYNKPTISLNVEGFVIFICNAWELLMKAYLLSNNESIYYKKSGSSNRSYSLDNLIKKVMTNSNDSTRINLEIVSGIRNFATHLIIPEYASTFNEMFLSCVRNYSNKIFKWFGININDRFDNDFLVIHIPSSKKNVDIQGKYGRTVYQKYYDTTTFVSKTLLEKTKDNGVVPEELALSYEITFKKVNDSENANMTMYNAKNEESVKTVTVVKTQNANITHPLKTSAVIDEVNLRLETTGVSFTPYTQTRNTRFTSDSFKLICRGKNIKKIGEFSYLHEFNNQYTYSYKLVEYIIDCIQNDPDVFIKIKEQIKKS